MDRFKLFEELMKTLHEITTGFNEYESIPRKYGIEEMLFMAETHMLNMIFENEGITLGELSRITRRSNGAISHTITKLINKGLVIKKKMPEDNRSFVVFLTEKGNLVHNYHKNYDRKEFSRLLLEMDSVSEEDFITCIRVMSLISNFEFLKNDNS